MRSGFPVDCVSGTNGFVPSPSQPVDGDRAHVRLLVPKVMHPGVCHLVYTGVSSISAETGLGWEPWELAGKLHNFLLILLLSHRGTKEVLPPLLAVMS